MIRALQKDNRVTKAIFAVIIGAATLSMVLYLVPGLYDGVVGAPQGVYATVRKPGILGRIFGETTQIKTTEVQQYAQSLAQRQNYPAQYLPFLMPRLEQQAQQVLVASAVEDREAERLGLSATDADVMAELQTGQLGAIFFPGGKFIGDDKYKAFVTNQLGFATVAEFETKVKQEITSRRLVQFVTSGATVSDNSVRDLVRKQGAKIKFDYAVVNSDDVAKSVNPIDSDLESYFKRNTARYANAIPEKRKISFIPVTMANLPGGKPQVSDADIQTYYNAHKAEYHVDQQVKVRHILIKSPQGADAKTDAAAKAKAQDILNKIHGGADFGALAKANSDDPGSKDSGGELGYVKADGQMVPAFQAAAMKLKAGETSDLVKTSFGYHIINAEARDEAHDKSLAEVSGEIRPILEQQNGSKALQALASQIASEAAKSGMDKAAADHGLKATTTDFIAGDDKIAAVPDSTQLMQAAFTGKKSDAPRLAPAGQGTMAVYQTVDLQPAHAPTFAEWKDHVLADYRSETVPQLLQAKLSKLSERAKQLGDLHKAAAELNVPVKTSDLVDRKGNVPGVGDMSGAAGAAFDLPKGGISGPLNAGPSGAVVQIVDKEEPSADEIAKAFTAMRTQLIDQQRAEIFGIYMQTLIDNYTKQGAIRILQKPAAAGSPLGI
jgi:peptidyl-prolyl cis-trans isomerase D